MLTKLKLTARRYCEAALQTSECPWRQQEALQEQGLSALDQQQEVKLYAFLVRSEHNLLDIGIRAETPKKPAIPKTPIRATSPGSSLRQSSPGGARLRAAAAALTPSASATPSQMKRSDLPIARNRKSPDTKIAPKSAVKPSGKLLCFVKIK
jgi:hypothetical protein